MTVDSGPTIEPLLALTTVQHLFLDGIRYSVRMSALCYGRLRALVTRLSDGQQIPSDDDFTNIFPDAWFMVDVTNRLRRLTNSFPGLKKNDPQITMFFRSTQGVEELRNFIQHAEGDISDLAERQYAFWGSVSWFRRYSRTNGLLCSIRAGSSHQAQESIPWINPLGRMSEPPVDLITLHAAGFEVVLSDVARATEGVARAIDDQIRTRFNVATLGAPDLYVTAELEGHDEPSSTEGV